MTLHSVTIYDLETSRILQTLRPGKKTKYVSFGLRKGMKAYQVFAVALMPNGDVLISVIKKS